MDDLITVNLSRSEAETLVFVVSAILLSSKTLTEEQQSELSAIANTLVATIEATP